MDTKMLKRCQRKPLWASLFGSWNYNLNTKDSDIDVRVYTMPTFKDLYERHLYIEKIAEKDSDDYDFHDIRRLPNLLFKSNVTWLENLYSVNQAMYNDDIQKIINMRDEIVVMNLRGMYESTIGNIRGKIKLANRGKGTKSTQHMVDKFGYDTKEFLHCMRMIDLLTRFADNDFKNFGKCLKYTGQERETMLQYKRGRYSKEEANKLMTEAYSKLELLRDRFEVEPNMDTLKKLENIVFEIVRKEMVG